MNIFKLATRGIDMDAAPPDDYQSRPLYDDWASDAAAPSGGRSFSAPSDYDNAFQEAGAAYGVDPAVLKGMAMAESAFRPDIISGQKRSPVGAIGLMQFMPDTAKQYGINPLDPIESIFGAAAYMRKSLDKFDGDYGRAVASYNHGPNRDAYRHDDWDARIPPETQKYIMTVFDAADKFQSATSKPLPAGVTPSQAGAGRGFVNPPAEKPDELFSRIADDYGVPPSVVSSAVEAAKQRAISAANKNKWTQSQAASFYSSIVGDFVSDAAIRHQLDNKGFADTIKSMKLSDIPNMLNSGAVNLFEGANALLGNEYDAQLARKTSADIGKKYSNALRNEFSFTAGATKATVESLPGMAAGMALGAPLGAGLNAVMTGTNAGRAALLATGLRSPTAAAILEGAPSKIGAALGEASVSSTSGAAQAAQEFDAAMKSGDVQKTDRFKALSKELGSDSAAADVIRRDAINRGAAYQGLATGATSVLFPNLEARMISRASGGGGVDLIDKLLQGKPTAALAVKAAKEPMQEFLQSGAESIAGDLAAKHSFDPNKSVGDKALVDASMGAVAGLATSGLLEGRGMARDYRSDLAMLNSELAKQPVKVEDQSTTPQAPSAAPDGAPSVAEQTSNTQAAQQQETSAPSLEKMEAVNSMAAALGVDPAALNAQRETPQATGGNTNTAIPQPEQGQAPAAVVDVAAPTTPTLATLPPAEAPKDGPILQNRDRSTAASIQQMQDIAARPDYGRLGFSRDFANGAPVVAGATESIPQTQMGRTDTAVAANGTRIPVQYAVVDAAQVLTSNRADGLPNVAYGDSQVQGIRAIAGNGRIAGLQAAYSRNTTETYKQEMMQDAALHGIAPEVIQGMQQPVLVRVMPNERVTKNIGDLSNTQSNLSLSAVEQAKNDVARVDLGALTFDEGGTVTQAAMRQFVMAMPATEQGQLMDTNGRPTRQAVDRLNAAIFARAYGNDQLVRLYAQAQDPEARLVMSALAQVAPKMARLEGLGALDVREIVTQAAEIAVNARREGKSIGVAARQLDIAAEGAVAVVLDLFASSPRSSKPVIEALSRMADIAYVEATKPESDMFGQVPKATREQIIDTLREGQANDTASPKNMEQQAGGQLDGGNAEGGSPQRGESPDAGTAQAGKQPAASPTQQQDQLLAYSRQEAKDRQQTNDEVAVLPDNAVKFSRTSSARAAYEARIDELFDGAKANLKGVRVLDKADLLGLLGYADKPVNLFEGKVIGGQKNHPHMTAEVWKKVPEWLDAPAAVFDSDTVIGRLVFVAPELVNGYMALIIVEPNAGALDAHVLVNAYDKDGGDPPIRRWVKDGLTRYVDQKKFPTVFNTSRLQLPGTAFQNKPGTRKILTEKNLSGYKKSAFDPNDADIRKSFAGQSAKTADTMALSTAQARLRDGDDAETVRQETGWFKGVDGKWRFEINDADASLKIGYKGNPIALGAEKVPNQSGWMRLSDVLDHPALFAAYPDLQDTLVKILPTSEMKGSLGFFRQSDMSITLDGGMNKVKALSVLLHEVQHGIQSIEGFASGGSVKNAGNLAENDYMRLAGEVEARNVQARQKMNGSERRAMPPIATADVPDADAIVVFNGERMDSAESLAQSKARPRTPAANIRKALEKAYGKLFSRLESQGLVTLAQTEQEAIEAAARARADKLGRDYQDELDELMDAVSASKSSDLGIKYSADGLIQGFFDPTTRRAYMVADALFEDTAGGVLMHEVGIHMAADGKLAPLLNRANLMVKNAKGEFFDTVRAKMEKAGETSAEEAAAYLVEAYENNKNNTPPSVKQWFKDFMAAVRAWLFSKGVILTADQLTAADIAAVARANARGFARGGEIGDGGGAPISKSIGGSPQPPATATTQPRSLWRDETNRFQFAPGAYLWEKMGEKAAPFLSWAMLKTASPELRAQLRRMKLDIQKAQETAATVATESAKFSESEREMVSDLVEKTLKAGVLPPDHAVKMAALMNDVMGKQTDELIELGMLDKDTADRLRGKYLPRYYESKMGKKDPWTEAMMQMNRRAGLLKGVRGKHLKGRGLFEVVAVEQQADYEALGWEVRDPDFDPAKDKKVQMWRDFTPEEREKMGEIRDAGFRFVAGYMATQKDIALGRMFRAIANDESLSARVPDGNMVVKVPDTKVEGTGVNVYGELAGRYVSQDTLSILSSQAEMQNDLLMAYKKAMSIWKEGKTVLNPVSHVNNVVSNITMAHLAGVSYHRVDKYIGAIRDFAKKSNMIQEAKDAGLFLGSFNETELYQSMPQELRALAEKAESTTDKSINTAMKLLTFGLRGVMQKAYGLEDDFFKYLLYRDARSRGASPDVAVDFAQKYIFTYDDLPKTARVIRDTALPFFAYTYKAIPAFLHTAMTQPHRMAVPATLLYGATMLAYAIAASEADEPWDEIVKRYLTDESFRDTVGKKRDEAQKSLPPWQRGYTAFMTPKAMLVGHDKALDLPVYMDISRFIPGGDLFDVAPNAGGIPLPAPITPSHPVLSIGVSMIGNKDLFTGKDLVDKNDTRGEAALKRSDWMWKQIAPAISIGGYHYERAMNMIAQASGKPITIIKDYTGRDRTGMPVTADYGIPQTFGIKIRPVDFDYNNAMEAGQNKKLIDGIKAEVKQLARLRSKGFITDESFDAEVVKASKKIQNLGKGLTVDGDKKD